NVGVVRYLLDSGLMNVDAVGNYPAEPASTPPSATALHLSAMGAEEVAMASGISVQGHRPKASDVKITTLLLERRANFTIRDHYGNMPIHLASREGNCNQVGVL